MISRFAAAMILFPALSVSPTAGNSTHAELDRGTPTIVTSAPTLGRAPVCESTTSRSGQGPGPEYYRIDLVSTRRVPGSASAGGEVDVTYMESPFGLSVAADGSYLQDLEIQIDGLRPSRRGVYVAWVTTTDLDQVTLLGTLDGDHRMSGQVQWNKFLVVVSLEPDAESIGSRWSGPIVLRGISRSGFMHTLAGHGPFEDEKCAGVGYN